MESNSFKTITPSGGGTLLLRRDIGCYNECDEVVHSWDKIFNEIKVTYPHTTFKFIPNSYVIKKNPGMTVQKKILESILAIPEN